jgi:hydrogenase maturation protease
VTPRVLVAGVGNLFKGDDGFGPEVARRLAAGGPLPPGVRVTDYGIRGTDLAYDLLDGWDTLILIDALPIPRRPHAARGPEDRAPGGVELGGVGEPRGGRPGEVVVVEVGPGDLEPGGSTVHGMQPVAVLGSLTAMGGKLPPTYIVGCPAEWIHEGIGLSPAVSAAVPAAIDAILALIDRLPLTGPPVESRRP